MARASVTNNNFNVQLRNSSVITISTISCHFGPQSQQEDIMSPRQAIFAFVVTVLLNFLQLKYHGKSKSPFQTHPNATILAIASLVIYCISYDAKLRFSKAHPPPPSSRGRFICISLALFGPLSLASILSMLVPQPFCPLLFSLAILFSFCQLPPDRIKTKWDLLKELIRNKFCAQPQRTRTTTTSTGVVRLVSARLAPFAGHPTTDQIDLVPV